MRTFPYNISQNLIGYGVFTLTHSCKTLSQVYVKLDQCMIYLLLLRPVSKALSKLYLKIVTCFSPSWPPFSFSMGPVDPSVENPGTNNTEMMG